MQTEGFYELRIFQDENNSELYQELKKRSDEHNQNFTTNPLPDSGFDLPTPTEHIVKTGATTKINLAVKCVLVYHTYNRIFPTAYYIYPRSSTGSKTPLRLANSVGVIDAGYRGNLIAAFDNISNMDYTVEKFQRLVQICLPSLQPFMVSIHTDLSQLDTTERGVGGFGSTGK